MYPHQQLLVKIIQFARRGETIALFYQPNNNTIRRRPSARSSITMQRQEVDQIRTIEDCRPLSTGNIAMLLSLRLRVTVNTIWWTRPFLIHLWPFSNISLRECPLVSTNLLVKMTGVFNNRQGAASKRCSTVSICAKTFAKDLQTLFLLILMAHSATFLSKIRESAPSSPPHWSKTSIQWQLSLRCSRQLRGAMRQDLRL